VRSLFESARRVAAFTSVLIVLAPLGCNVRVGPGQQPRQQQQPQPQQPFEHTLGAPEAKFDDAVKLFNMGAEGEARYKGKVVEVSGRVNVEAVPPAPQGGTTVVKLEGGAGGSVHAVATVDEASSIMLSRSHWKPEAGASIHGIYRGRDQNGAILLDQARVMGLGPWTDPAKNPFRQPSTHKLGKPEATFFDVAELFNMGAEGEAKYQGKVIDVYGRVDVESTKPAPQGGTTVVSLEGGKGGKVHAVATVDEASSIMLSKSHWKPEARASIHGIYRGRDQNGAILLDQARVMGLQSWSGLVKVQPDDKRKDSDKRKTDKDKDKKPADTVVVSPETLAQELTDDIVKNYPRYYKADALQIKGVIHKRAEDKGMIVRIDFQVPVRLKGDKKDDFVIFCGLKDRVSLKGKEAADLAVGKTVTIRGKLTAGGNGQATLYQCEIVRDD
jgi:hypothetical protein